MNITEPIRRRARTQPQATALISGSGRHISYAELDRRIDASAAHAAGLGLRPGDVVGFALGTTPELIYGLGLARLGVVSADTALPTHLMRIRLTPGPPADAASLRFDSSWTEPHGAPSARTAGADAASDCRIFASSGTTGPPKFIPLSHGTLTRRVRTHWLGQGPEGGRRLILAGFGSTLGFGAALRTLFEGGCLVLGDPARAAEAMTRHGVTALTASPHSLRALIDRLPEAPGPFPALRAIEAGGHRIPPALRRAVAERLRTRLVSHLGATEVGRIASASTEDIATRPGAAGFLLPGVVMQAVDDQDQPLPPGEKGILRVRTEAMVAGYLGADTTSNTQGASTGATSFRDGWFYPGDTGAIEPDGMVILAARLADLIQCGGNTIDPIQIEDALCRLPLVTDAAAFAVPDEYGVTRLWAAISAATRIDQSVLSAWCAQTLPGRAPRTILQVDRMPRTDSGKILKALLIEHALRLQAGAR